MASQVHAVVQNARNFDNSVAYDAVQQQMTPAASVPSHVDRINASENVIA